jgi:hypothetical protein
VVPPPEVVLPLVEVPVGVGVGVVLGEELVGGGLGVDEWLDGDEVCLVLVGDEGAVWAADFVGFTIVVEVPLPMM